MNSFDSQFTGGISGLIVLFTPETDVETDDQGRIVSLKGKDQAVSEVNNLLEKFGAEIRAIGSKTPGGKPLTNASQLRFFVIHGSGYLDELRRKLLQINIVDSAYFKPADEDPTMDE
jgi:hypothetical protein